MAKLPKTIYVHEEIDGKDIYLSAAYTLQDAAPDMGETRVVGKYELRETNKVTTEARVIKK